MLLFLLLLHYVCLKALVTSYFFVHVKPRVCSVFLLNVCDEEKDEVFFLLFQMHRHKAANRTATLQTDDDLIDHDALLQMDMANIIYLIYLYTHKVVQMN